MNNKILIETIGKSCKRWRLTMGYEVKQVSIDTGYSYATVSMFERGLNNNASIFCWYLAHGFDVRKDFVSFVNPFIKVGISDVFNALR